MCSQDHGVTSLKTETSSTEQYVYSAGAPVIIKWTLIGKKSADRKKLRVEICCTHDQCHQQVDLSHVVRSRHTVNIKHLTEDNHITMSNSISSVSAARPIMAQWYRHPFTLTYSDRASLSACQETEESAAGQTHLT